MSNQPEQRTPEEQALLDAAASTISETPVEPVLDPPAADITPDLPAAPEQHRYEYQPTDESGRPIGGKQVIVYSAPEELAQKLTEQNTLLIRKLREETRKNRLGIQDRDEIEEAAQKFEAPVSFAPKVLTAEQRLRIARDMNDPETFDQAADELLEARLGAKPEVFAKTVSDLQMESLRNRALAESEAFVQANPDFVRCEENGKAITAWIVRYDLAPVQANYQKAFDALKAAGVLVLDQPTPPAEVVAPVEVSAPVAAPAVEIPAPIVEPAGTPAPSAPTPATAVPRIPTGLTRQQSSDIGLPRPVGEDIVYDIVSPQGTKRYVGAAALNAMPSGEYKHRLLHEPGFREKADKIEQAESARRRFVKR
jgi:hypothetical protein